MLRDRPAHGPIMPAHALLDRALASAQPLNPALLVHCYQGTYLCVEAIDDSRRTI
jgi:hypothetical protein